MERKPTHPGEVLLHEFIEPMGLTQAKLSKHLGWTYARLNEIVNGKRGITANSAIDLSEAFGTSIDFWLNLQMAYEVWEAKKVHKQIKLISSVLGNKNNQLSY